VKKSLKYASFFLLIATAASAALPVVEFIDLPTAEVTDHYGAHVSFRFYSGGGVLTKTDFGVLPRFNVGFGLDAEHFIGQETVDLNRPTLNMKLRVYDGARNLPALALGYDGQGYFFDKETDKYRQREKGLYAVGSGEVLTPGLSLTGGLNIYDFRTDDVYGFTGVQYLWQELVGIIFEADNLFHRPRYNRFNLGGRYHVTPSFALDVAGRDLWAGGREAERIVRISYSASF
jgi:hypothetical protein